MIFFYPDFTHAQVEQEQQEWAELAAKLKPWLDSNTYTREQFFWALAVVRSRAFSGGELARKLRHMPCD